MFKAAEHATLTRISLPAGKPVAYKMMTNAAPLMLATPSSLLQARGGFALKNIWVTPHDEAERWPAGSYTIQSQGGEGLPEWSKQNRAVDSGNDPVVWHSFGEPLPFVRLMGVRGPLSAAVSKSGPHNSSAVL